MLLADATNVKGVVMTSSPGPMPWTSRARWSAVVPEEVATAWRAPQNAANLSSNSRVTAPCASWPLSRTARTACFSSSEMSGLAIGIVVDAKVTSNPFQHELTWNAKHAVNGRYRQVHASYLTRHECALPTHFRALDGAGIAGWATS